MITFDKAELISFPEKVKIGTLLSRPSDLSDIPGSSDHPIRATAIQPCN